MNVSRILQAVPLLGALTLAGCDAGRVTDPLIDETSLSDEDQIALELIAEPVAVEAAMDLIDVPVATAGRHGMGWSGQAAAAEASVLARERFQEAVKAMNAEDSAGALERAREARRLVVRAMVALGGQGAVARLVERAEGLASASGEPGRYAYSHALGEELNGLAKRARQRLQLRDSLGAGDCAVLAEQRHRQRHGDPAMHPGGAAVAVELASTAVSLATRLVDEAGGPSEEQTRLLAVAADYATAANDALEAGNDAWALHLYELAQWTTLQAVVWPDGVSTEEARVMLSLAQMQYEAAAATDPTDVAADLLLWASDLIDFGQTAVEQMQPRGTGALWRAAVICTWMIR